MAREHARILCRIWSDPDFKRRSEGAQRMYFLLLSQRLLNHAGVVPMTVQKWANCAADSDVAAVHRHLEELEQHDYVVTDAGTEELLVRSFIRNDGVAKQPQVLKAALRLACEIESPGIRLVLAGELRKLGKGAADRIADLIEPNFAEPLANTLPEPIEQPAETLPEGFAKGSEQPIVDISSASEEALREGFPKAARRVGQIRGGKGIGEGEGEGEGGKGRGKPTRAPARDDPDFEAFYVAYPKRVARKAAASAWDRAIKGGVDPAVVIAGAKRYADDRRGKDPQFTKQPATWLNQGCWDDEPQPTFVTGHQAYQNPTDPNAYYGEL